ncbi:MAG TPA: 2-hydroxychromene-2-carboxylate isomerase [Thermoanaerobaculia bacterium]|nr:2-hydroxychromene-2-carboxylate isomerase [Thermoanaerobaculia bacterium]
MAPPLDFYLDYISHNAYLAWTQVHGLATRYGREVRPVPVVFGVLLQRWGQLGPAEVRPKARWMVRDVARKALRLGVPLSPPHSHPFNPLLALRVTCQVEAPEALRRLVDELFRATWVDGRDITKPEVVAAAASAASLDGAALVAGATSPETKERLRGITNDAADRGVFGVPTVIADGELFWGFDDFPNLDAFLRGEDPLAGYDWRAWQQVRPSVQRKRRDPGESARRSS